MIIKDPFIADPFITDHIHNRLFVSKARGGARGVPGGSLPPKILPGPPVSPQNFSGLFLKDLHRPLTAPLVAKLAPPVASPNKNVWLHPCLGPNGAMDVRQNGLDF